MADRLPERPVIRILIADDHAIVREGLRWLITTEPGMELAGEAVDGEEVVWKAQSIRPDVILLDLVMPRKDGIEAIDEIKRRDPEARILVLTSFAEDEKVFSAIKAGALGYLIKDSSPQDLLQAIRDVYRGEPSMSPTIAQKLMREVAVLRLVAQGLSNQEIGERLVISERTVRTHVSNILDKLHLANRTQAALYALKEGLAHLDNDRAP
jgi:NarL family two-component system response regulator LiaR